MRYKSQEFKPEVLHKILSEYDKLDYPMMGACFNKVHNLVTGHAYTLLGAITLKKDGKDVLLYKMRNPWGNEQYDGPWGDNDNKNWTAELKKQVNFESNLDDGIFYMTAEDLPKAFPVVEVSLHKHWQVMKKQVKSSKKTEFEWQIENPVDQEITFSVDLVAERLYPAGCKNYTKQSYRLELDDQNGKNLKYVWASSFLGFGNIHLEKLTKGKYRLKVYTSEETPNPGGNAFTLTLYGAEKNMIVDG